MSVCAVHWELLVGVRDWGFTLEELTSNGRDNQVIPQINIKLQVSQV